MTEPFATGPTLHRKLVDTLYVEAMLLADEARSLFDRGFAMTDDGDRTIRVGLACESLKVTTRLMHVIAWLLTQRAALCGEIGMADARDPSRSLGDGPESDPVLLTRLPATVRHVVEASIELHRRARRLEASLDAPAAPSPARIMLERLALGL